ncbi:hypothetical protein [Mycolicibacterium fortuitum]|nr:hypothetical protein [Mycolicibacterium fortuitum]
MTGCAFAVAVALDLTKSGIDERIAAATNPNLIEAIFTAEGMAYP